MSIWHYATTEGQQYGPLSTEELTDLFHAGRIGPRTRVWRQGEPEWRLLADFMDELGLNPAVSDGQPVPPGLPPMPRSGTQSDATTNNSTTNRPASAPPAPAPKKGRSGCAIVGIVLVLVGLFVVLPVVGIIAAISLPAYQDYSMRAKTAEILAQAQGAKTMMAEFAMGQGRCPTEQDAVFRSMEEMLKQSNRISSLSLESPGPDDYLCNLELKVNMPDQSQLHDRTIWLRFDMDTYNWTCSADISPRFLPASCRD